MVRRKYKPYATRKQKKNRMMRNVVLTLIVLIVAIVIFNKNYNGEDSVPEQANAQTTTLDNVLPSGGSETESDTGPLVVLNPAVDSAEPSTGTEPESESVAAFTPEEPVAAVETAATEAEEAVVEPIKEDSLSVPNDATDATSQEAKELIQEALRLRDADKIIAARELLNDTLNMQLSSTLRSQVKTQLSRLAETWLFGRGVLEGDKLTSYYEVQRGELLQNIAKRHKVPYEMLMQINGISRPELLQAGKTIKVINGPFNAVVYKHSFTMDLYLKNKYVKTYRVGLGRTEHETPTGRWRVKGDGKLDNKPTWTDPDTGRTYVGDDPDYPLGSRWIGLEGLEGDAEGRTGFAIHGTKDPESIGTRSSRGCIRLFNGHAIEVYNLLYGGVSEVLVKD